jgi:hypothetical protein
LLTQDQDFQILFLFGHPTNPYDGNQYCEYLSENKPPHPISSFTWNEASFYQKLMGRPAGDATGQIMANKPFKWSGWGFCTLRVYDRRRKSINFTKHLYNKNVIDIYAFQPSDEDKTDHSRPKMRCSFQLARDAR